MASKIDTSLACYIMIELSSVSEHSFKANEKAIDSQSSRDVRVLSYSGNDFESFIDYVILHQALLLTAFVVKSPTIEFQMNILLFIIRNCYSSLSVI